MKAKRLNKNSIIGVCAPSGYVKEKNKEELDYAKKLLKELDLEVKYSKNLYSNSLGYSATVEEKQEDINFLIKNKSVNAIAFAKGGNNANSILDLIDYEDIKKNPKIFFGFSDNTVLLNAIYKMTGLITYHFTNFKGLFSVLLSHRQQFRQPQTLLSFHIVLLHCMNDFCETHDTLSGFALSEHLSFSLLLQD